MRLTEQRGDDIIDWLAGKQPPENLRLHLTALGLLFSDLAWLICQCKGRTLFTPAESSSLKHWTGKAFEDKATAALGSDTERLHLKGLSVVKGRGSGRLDYPEELFYF